jgi:hypothetical protein
VIKALTSCCGFSSISLKKSESPSAILSAILLSTKDGMKE